MENLFEVIRDRNWTKIQFSAGILTMDIGCLGLLCVIGIVFNVITIFVFQKDKEKTPMVIYLMALAVMDGLYLLEALSTNVLSQCLLSVGMPSAFKVLMIDIKKWTWPVSCMLQTASTWLVVLIAVSRYSAIDKPFKFAITSKKRAVICIVGVTTFALVINIPRFFQHLESNRVEKCLGESNQPLILHSSVTDELFEYDMDEGFSNVNPTPGETLTIQPVFKIPLKLKKQTNISFEKVALHKDLRFLSNGLKLNGFTDQASNDDSDFEDGQQNTKSIMDNVMTLLSDNQSETKRDCGSPMEGGHLNNSLKSPVLLNQLIPTISTEATNNSCCSLILADPPMLSLGTIIRNNQSECSTHSKALKHNKWYNYIYLISLSWILLYVVPFFLLILYNFKLCCVVRRSIKMHADLVARTCDTSPKPKISSTLSVIGIVTLFIVCQTMDFILIVLQIFVSMDPETALLLTSIANCFLALNAGMNFVIYTLFFWKFRQLLKASRCC